MPVRFTARDALLMCHVMLPLRFTRRDAEADPDTRVRGPRDGGRGPSATPTGGSGWAVGHARENKNFADFTVEYCKAKKLNDVNRRALRLGASTPQCGA